MNLESVGGVAKKNVMPWSPLIFLTVLFGVICGNRLMDNRIQRQFAASRNVAAINVPNNEFDGNNIGDVPPCHQINGLEGNILNEFYGLKECDNVRKDAILYGANSNDYQLAMENTKTNREFLTGSSRNAAKSDSDIMEVPALKFDDINNDEISSTLRYINKNSEQQGARQANVEGALPSFSSTFVADYTEDKIGNDIQNVMDKRANNAPIVGCDCKIKNDVIDLGQQHFPRYLLNAVCESKSVMGYPQKCWRGSHCKPLEYNVKVLKPRNILDRTQKEQALAWLPDDLRQFWIFETVTVAAGCFCSY